MTGCVVDAVYVGLAFGAVTGVEGTVTLRCALDPDVGWQKTVQTPLDIYEGDLLFCNKIDDLTEGVDAGIRPAGTVDLYGMVEYPFYRPAQYFFDGNAVGLTLPTMIVRSVVFNDEGYISTYRF